jgi:catechol 2,3-dioxygenase-like lactoylglutathione lyase family enzyme
VLFDHITIRVSDRAASELFYDTVLGTLGPVQRRGHQEYTVWNGEFSLAHADDDHPVTRRLHVAFMAPSREHVDAFWRAGVEAGYGDDGKPGPRPQYSESYYGGFLLDPDGNSAEAVHHDDDTPPGRIDHLWIRVAEVAAAKEFYEHVAPFGRFRLNNELPDRVQFTAPIGSMSFVAGEPTDNLHLAFETNENEVVDAFHRALTEAGYRDNGPPGERAVYHSGYYGAFVLDPDGNNVEIVNHNRNS